MAVITTYHLDTLPWEFKSQCSMIIFSDRKERWEGEGIDVDGPSYFRCNSIV